MQPDTMKWCGPDLGPFRIEIIPKKIKHIYFKVYPTQKKVVVSVPIRLTRQEWERAVLSKQAWLLKQVARPYHGVAAPGITNLSHERVRLNGVLYPVLVSGIQHSATRFVLEEDGIHVFLKKPLREDKIRILLETWLRDRLGREIGRLVAAWEPRLGVRVDQYRVRKMKTRWGSCNIGARRIWLNMALVHLPLQYLEYVVVHEMVHLLERRHNRRFKSYLDVHVPNWRQLNARMERFPL